MLMNLMSGVHSRIVPEIRESHMESALPCSGDKTLIEFFKVFLIQKGSTQLQLPTSFTKFFTGIAPCKVTLVDLDGKCLDVNLEKIEGRLVFKDGWQKFAKEKNLEEGDFLVFQYDGMSIFNVKIFSKTGCRKVAAPPSSEKIFPIVNLEEDSDQHNNKIQSHGKRKRSLPRPKLNVKSEVEGACPSTRARGKSKRVKEEKDIHNEKKLDDIQKEKKLEKKLDLTNGGLQNPHFQIYFDSTYKLKRVEFPRRVVKNMNIKFIPKITLRDENNRLWPVSVLSSAKEDRHFLGGGWFDFKRDNNIREGDRCDFQFVVDTANVATELLVRVFSDGSLYWVDCK